MRKSENFSGRCFSPDGPVFDERLHAVEAGFVERLQDVERGEEKRAGAAGRVEDRDVFDRVPEGAEQLRAFAVLDHVLGELANVEVEGDEVVDVADLAAGELRLHSSQRLRRATTSRQISVGKANSAGAGLFQLVRLETTQFKPGGDIRQAVACPLP